MQGLAPARLAALLGATIAALLLGGAWHALAQTVATPPAAIEITPSDDGQTLQVVVGQGVTVRLGSTLQWQVSFNPPDVLQAVPGVNTTTRDVQAILRAAHPGTAVMTAQGKPVCNPGQACPQLVQQVTVTVVVSPASGGTAATAAPAPTTGTAGTPIAAATRPPATATRPPSVQLPNTGKAENRGTWIAVAASAAAALLSALAALALRRRERG
jgi:hypothetical protein